MTEAVIAMQLFSGASRSVGVQVGRHPAAIVETWQRFQPCKTSLTLENLSPSVQHPRDPQSMATGIKSPLTLFSDGVPLRSGRLVYPR